ASSRSCGRRQHRPCRGLDAPGHGRHVRLRVARCRPAGAVADGTAGQNQLVTPPATTRPSLRFGVAHDFRCPPGSPYTLTDVYAQTMEQIALLDRLGLDLVWFSEHHFVDDGYLPNFVPVAGAVAAATERMR